MEERAVRGFMGPQSPEHSRPLLLVMMFLQSNLGCLGVEGCVEANKSGEVDYSPLWVGA